MSQAVLDGVRDLLPTLRERAEEAERLRVVPEASIKEIEETGFFRLLQPKRYDGLEADPVDFYTAVRRSPAPAGRPAGCRRVVGVHPWQVALFADEAQQAVWGEDTTTRLSSSYAPTGKAVSSPTAASRSAAGGASPPAATTASGCCSAAWCSTPRARSSTSARSWCRASRLHDRGRLERRRPARHRLQRHRRRGRRSSPRRSRCRWATPAAASAPARSVNTSDLYKLPFHSVFTMTISTPLIGMAYGAYAEHVEMQRKRVRAAYLGREDRATTRYAAVRIARAVQRDRRGLGAAGRTTSASCRRTSTRGEKIPLELRLQGAPRPGDRAPSGPSARSTRCSRPPAAVRSPRAPTCSGPGATRTPAGCTRPTTPSGRCRCSARYEFGHKIDPGMY